jgi:hypothetical protein
MRRAHAAYTHSQRGTHQTNIFLLSHTNAVVIVAFALFVRQTLTNMSVYMDEC